MIRTWMTAALVGSLAMPAALSVQASAQDECNCLVRPGPSVSVIGPDGFAFVTGGRARIGIGFESASQDDYADVGALITEVVEDSPAEEAGLMEGDVVLSVDGHSLMDPLPGRLERRISEDGSAPVQRLMALARDWDVDEPVELVVDRDGSDRTITVVPEERTFDFAPMRFNLDRMGDRLEDLGPRIQERIRGLETLEHDGPWRLEGGPDVRVWRSNGDDFAFGFGRIYGLNLAPVNADLGSYFGVDTGVLVIDAADSGLGLEAGDVILSIGDREVDSPDDVRRILRSYEEGDEVTFEVQRDRARQSVTSTID